MAEEEERLRQKERRLADTLFVGDATARYCAASVEYPTSIAPSRGTPRHVRRVPS